MAAKEAEKTSTLLKIHGVHLGEIKGKGIYFHVISEFLLIKTNILRYIMMARNDQNM